MLDEVLVARQASHSDCAGDPVINGSQPPGARATHAHAGGADPLFVHLRPSTQVIEGDLVVVNEHAPECAAQPEVELEQALLLGLSSFVWTARPRAGALAVPRRVGGHYDIAGLHKDFAQRLRAAV